MIIYKTVQKVISQDSQQKMQFLEYKTTLRGHVSNGLSTCTGTTCMIRKLAKLSRQEV